MTRAAPLRSLAKVAVSVLAAMLSSRAAAAQASYRVEHFTTNTGLPQNTISGIAQTPDGYLWFATYDGLVRYDGVTFTILDRGTTPAMGQTQFFGVLTDAAGTLWAGTSTGILRRRADTFDWLQPVPGAEGASHPGEARLQPEYAGKPLRWRPDGIGFVSSGSGAQRIRVPLDTAAVEFSRTAYEDRRGALWIPMKNGGLARLDSTGLRQFGTADGLPPDRLQFGNEDRDGNLWFSTTTSVLRVSGSKFTTVYVSGLTGTRDIRIAFSDREGTLWVGTNANGLYRLSPLVVRSYSMENGIGGRTVHPIVQDRSGRIMLGAGGTLTTYDGRFHARGIFRDRAGRYRLETVSPSDAPRSPEFAQVRSLYLDRDSTTLWVGLSDGIIAIDGDRILRSYAITNGPSDAILRDRAGNLWAGLGRGVLRIRGDSVRMFGPADGFPDAQVTAMHETPAGTLWIGTRNGLARRDGDRFVTMRREDGIGADHIRELMTDSTGALWIGTFDGGITRFKGGRLATITTRNGLLSNGVFRILPDTQGWYWMSGNRGISRVRREQLDAVADGRITTVNSVAYGARDGMKSAEANGGRQPAGLRARDGSLWFPTQDGVVVIDPADAARAAPPPLTVIERIEVDGQLRARVDSVELAPGQTDLEVAFTAPSSIHAEDIHFRYRLVGLHTGWIEAGTTRRVHYSHLPPDDYRFEVVAAGSNGAWNPTGASLGIVVEPRFYQTTWFLVTSLSLVLIIALIAYSRRIEGLKAAERRLTILVNERTAELQVANERLLQLATEDGLTGLANKRRFDEFLTHEWQRAQRTGSALSLLMIDVDDFKKYNDKYGHPAGDETLRQVAAVLGAGVRRGTDLAARYGGEEFAIVLTETGADRAPSVGETLRARVAGLAITHDDARAAKHVTISVGSATMVPGEDSAPEELTAAADRALYRAKEEGRNRVAT